MAELCPIEEEIVAAVIAGNFSETQSRHLATCADCQSAATVAGLLQAEKNRFPAEIGDIPSADIVWMRAAYEMHKKQTRRRKLVIMAGILMSIMAGVVTGLIIWSSGTTFSPESILPRMNLLSSLLLPATISALIFGLMLYIEYISNPESAYN